MTDDTEHARLSASSAHRWMRCAASLYAEEQIKTVDKGTSYSREGTAAHELLEKTLSNPAYRTFMFEGQKAKNGVAFDDDMLEHVQGVVDDVRTSIKNYEMQGARVTLVLEYRVHYSHIVGVPNSFGTGDIILIVEFADGTALIDIQDLKYGMGEAVYAQDNEQLRLYSIGAMHEFSWLIPGAFKGANGVIHMPRLKYIDEEYQTAEELEEFGHAARRAGQLAIAIADGKLPAAPEMYKPGKKQCRWCKASGQCAAQAAMIAKEVAEDFEDMTEEREVLFSAVSNEQLAKHALALDFIDRWSKAVRAVVEARLFAGEVIPEHKLVRGKKGNRTWKDAGQVEVAMKRMRLPQDEMYDMTIISPAVAEKRLAKTSRYKWNILEKLLAERSEGKIAVVHVSDKRPAIVVTPVVDDFDDIS